MNPTLAVALGLIALLGSSLLAMVLHVLTGIRDDLRGLTKRVGEHDSFIVALKTQHLKGAKI